MTLHAGSQRLMIRVVLEVQAPGRTTGSCCVIAVQQSAQQTLVPYRAAAVFGNMQCRRTHGTLRPPTSTAHAKAAALPPKRDMARHTQKHATHALKTTHGANSISPAAQLLCWATQQAICATHHTFEMTDALHTAVQSTMQ